MAKKTKHREWQGHRLFCNCNDRFRRFDAHYPARGDYPEGGDRCPDCRMWPWYYLNPADEPKQEG